MSKLTPEERERIVGLIEAGGKRNEIVRETGRSAGTVSAIAKEIDRPFDRSATKKATEAKRDYAQAERLELLNEGFDKARDLLPTIAEARDLQSWMVAVATGIDKRRLEDGEATERKENVDPSRRERIKAGLDEVARKRRERLG